jgi:two-component system NtrC family sensor kinase
MMYHAMVQLKNAPDKKDKVSLIISSFAKFRSSIFGRVVFIVTLSSILLFVIFWIIFRSVNEGYMRSILRENGNNIASLVESALYKSMLENDRTTLQSTLDIINNMSGIDDVNMYDNENNLAYSSISGDSTNHSNPDCKSCHTDLATMFPVKEKSVRIIDIDSECSMNHNNNNARHLLIRSPILNSESCYASSCHAHDRSEEVLGSLLIKFPLKDLDDALSKSKKDYILLAALITILLVTFLIVLTTKKIRKPLTALIAASEAVAKGDKSTRLEIKPNHLSDMRMVSLAFNDMLDNLQKANIELQNWSHQLEYKVQKKSEELGQAQQEMINIERIASLGRLSLSVAHEINNPLSGILVYAKLVHKQLNNQSIDPEKKETILKHLGFIISEAMRCGDIVKGLLDFSRKDQNDFEPRHLHEILHDTYDLMNHSMKVANIHFLSDYSAKADWIFCSPNQIKQVCVAILMNALEAITENGEILIRTINPDEEHIRIDITDNGTGISEEDIPHIFEPFFSTKEKTNGIGLGLAIVHGIIQNHKGKIEVKSGRGKGTTISISLSILKN